MINPQQKIIQPDRKKIILGTLQTLIVIAGLLATSTYTGLFSVLPDHRHSVALRILNCCSFALSILTILQSFVIYVALSTIMTDSQDFINESAASILALAYNLCWLWFLLAVFCSLAASMIVVFKFASFSSGIAIIVVICLVSGWLLIGFYFASKLPDATFSVSKWVHKDSSRRAIAKQLLEGAHRANDELDTASLLIEIEDRVLVNAAGAAQDDMTAKIKFLEQQLVVSLHGDDFCRRWDLLIDIKNLTEELAALKDDPRKCIIPLSEINVA